MKKKPKKSYIFAGLLIIGGFLYLIFSSITETSVYFLNVSEVINMEKKDIKHVRLFGMAENIKKGNDALEFFLVDKNDPAKKIQVLYSGNIPDTFREKSEVIIEGSIKKGVMFADLLMTKCPSKYKKRNN